MKRNALLLALGVVVLVAAPALADPPVTSVVYPFDDGDLAAYWAFEDNGDDSAPYDAVDDDGLKVGDASWNPYLALDGDGDYFEVPDSADLDLAGDFTIAAWVKTAVGDMRIVDKITAGSGDGYLLDMYGGLRLIVGGQAAAVVPASPLTDGAWHHVAASFDDATNEVVLYVDGVASAPVVIPEPDPWQNDLTLRIGADSNGNNEFDGSIDDVRIYTRVLSVGEIGVLAGLNGVITGTKFFDCDEMGVYDAGDPGLGGWVIDASIDSQSYQSGTDIGGFYYIIVPASEDPHVVTELPQPWWVQTYPAGGYYDEVYIGGGVIHSQYNFGNVALGGAPGDYAGHSKGFWGNKNGQALITAGDLANLVNMNLRNADGTAFDPASRAAFKTWLGKANAKNMAYMLSAQVAAMALNFYHGFVQPSSIIYAPGTNAADEFGFAQVITVAREANTELGVHGTAKGGDAWHKYQAALKDALDYANQDMNFLQPCPEQPRP